MGRALATTFYHRDTTVVARELLGAVLECRTPAGIASGRIVETEAYLGPGDPASHAVRGRTPRTVHLFGSPGDAYVYFIYGRYWCVNAVTQRAGAGHAVLVRAIEPLQGLDLMRARRRLPHTGPTLTGGPARLCLALGIDGRLGGVSLARGPLRVREGTAVPDAAVSVSPRIGITRAAEWRLRYFLTGNPYVSRTPPALCVGVYGSTRDAHR